jgi:hypothetical protein
VLNVCKDSVREFVKFILNYIPDSTQITSTSVVKNYFNNKPAYVTDEEFESKAL